MTDKPLHFPYSCNIPGLLIEDNEIPSTAKVFFGLLSGLAFSHGYCWATDHQLAELFKVKKRQILRWLEVLEERGFIRRETKNITNRQEDGKLSWNKTRKIFVSPGYTKQEMAPKPEGVKNDTSNEGVKNDTSNEGVKNDTYKSKPLKIEPISREHSSDSHSSSEPHSDLFFSHETGKFENITPQDLEDWKVAYPSVDLRREIVHSQEWLKSNPSKSRKKLWRKFITGWLTRTNDKLENQAAYRSANTSQTKSREWEANYPEDTWVAPTVTAEDFA